jgi:hypothetical protein
MRKIVRILDRETNNILKNRLLLLLSLELLNLNQKLSIIKLESLVSIIIIKKRDICEKIISN